MSLAQNFGELFHQNLTAEEGSEGINKTFFRTLKTQLIKYLQRPSCTIRKGIFQCK